MNKAKRLVVGNVVALVNPAGLPPERFRKFIPLMERYLVEEGFAVRSYLAHESANAKDLAHKFTEAWLDQDVRAVFPICGSDKIFEVMQDRHNLFAPNADTHVLSFCCQCFLEIHYN